MYIYIILYIYMYVYIYIILYIYMYVYIYNIIYIYINFKAINNVLDAKMVLKTHFFIKIFRLLYISFVSF